jgi:hypothetical protein
MFKCQVTSQNTQTWLHRMKQDFNESILKTDENSKAEFGGNGYLYL